MGDEAWTEVRADCLPADVWLHIMTYLDYKDLISCSFVSVALNELSSTDLLWKQHCQKHWLLNSCPSELTWKQLFVNWYKDFGRYVHCYSQIQTAWKNLKSVWETISPAVLDTLQLGVSDQLLDGIEREMNLKLPLDLRCSYRIHNGQSYDARVGIFGSVSLAESYRTETLLDIQVASTLMKINNANRPRRVGGCILPIITYGRSGFMEYVALNDDCGLCAGSVYTAASDTRFSRGGNRAFISGQTFSDWLDSYVNALLQGSFAIIDQEVYRFYHEPGCVERTGPFQVSVATCFLSEISTISPPFFQHAYRITMQMDSEASESESCQLESRHWVITDEAGNEECVDGPGVVGEFPIMRPRASFSWISCTSFKTTYGNMRGYFTMRNLRTGSNIEIQCPVFHMKCLPYISIPDLSPK